MNDDDKEPIIDSLLDELLGGATPPDLTQRVLGAYDAATQSWVDVKVGKAPAATAAEIEDAEETPLPVVAPSSAPRAEIAASKRAKRAKNWRSLQLLTSAAIILISATLFYGWAAKFNKEIAEGNIPPAQPKVVPGAEKDPLYVPPRDPNSAADSNVASDVNGGLLAEDNVGENPSDVPSVGGPNAPLEELVVVPEMQLVPTPFERKIELGPRWSDQRLLSFVNTQLKKVWDEDRTNKPTEAVNDIVWFQRASLLLRGHLPSQDEIESFRGNRDRESAVDVMLGSNSFPRHWGSVIGDMLVRNRPKIALQHRQLTDFIASSIRDGEGYDQLVFELISAVGSNDPDDDEHFNPAVNFMLAYQQVAGGVDGKKRNDEIKVAAVDKVCQTFMGKQMQCAQCHDHGETSQEQYHQLAAFFSQMRFHGAGQNSATWKLANDDFVGDAGNPDEAALAYQTDDGEKVRVFPRFVDGRTPGTTSGRVSDIDRRAEFAQMVVSSDDFATATVNRIWKQSLGFGFTMPVDDIGDHNPASHPQLLAGLARELKNSKYDIKSTLKVIALSVAFDRAYRPPSSPSVGQFDNFASFGQRETKLPGVAQGLQRLAKAQSSNGGVLQVSAFLGNNYGNDKMSKAKKGRVLKRIQDRALLFQSKTKESARLNKIAKDPNMSNRQKVIHLFFATLGRRPNNQELRRAMEMLKGGGSKNPLQDISWILLNNDEFVSQH